MVPTPERGNDIATAYGHNAHKGLVQSNIHCRESYRLMTPSELRSRKSLVPLEGLFRAALISPMSVLFTDPSLFTSQELIGVAVVVPTTGAVAPSKVRAATPNSYSVPPVKPGMVVILPERLPGPAIHWVCPLTRYVTK